MDFICHQILICKFVISWICEMAERNGHQNCSDLLWEKNCSIDWEKCLKFEAEGGEFAKYLRSLEQFIQTMNGFETECFFNLLLEVYQFTIIIKIWKNNWDLGTYRKSRKKFWISILWMDELTHRYLGISGIPYITLVYCSTLLKIVVQLSKNFFTKRRLKK